MADTDYQAYSIHNFRNIPQLARLNEEQRFAIEVVGQVLPFKVNNFVIDHLIDWDNLDNDPMYRLTFPQREMLLGEHYNQIADLLRKDANKDQIRKAADHIRMRLNPHPAGQMQHNVPEIDGDRLSGVQHKYQQTVLFFPSQGQTCHAYCSFCFRWPQFVGISALKFSGRETELLIRYLEQHPEVSDVLFTGGDPLIMSSKHLAAYIEPLLASNLTTVRRIRIGTKALSYWPYRFLNDPDADELLRLFAKVADKGKHLAIMAHFNHWRELQPDVVHQALAKIQETGAVVRTQSPLIHHINDDPAVWARMWNEQIDLNCIPYYMFVARDTGAHHYFSVPLVKAWNIFQQAYQQVSGLCRTVRGPSMSASPGKIQVLGVTEVKGEKVIELRFIQGRNPDWIHRPFFAAYDEQASWLNELRPAFGDDKFFFEHELEEYYRENINTSTIANFE